MTVTKNKVVSIDYTLKDASGTVIDSSKDTGPLEYLHGNGNLIPGLESQLEGKAVGDKFSAVIEPKDAYGEYDDKLVVKVPRTQFDSNTPITTGMQFQADTAGGPTVVKVTEVTDDTITVDANHDLAGKTLYFDINVLGVRDATEEELTPHSSCSGSCGSCGSGCCGSDEGECSDGCCSDGCCGQ
jgi:FKBP-type peptidyl-prolyl cis-trans isomerase SlyD